MTRSLIGPLKKLYIKQFFEPGPLGLFVNPFYFSRKELLRAVRHFSGHLNGKLLDVGCGTQPYRGFFNVEEYVGVELDSLANRKNKKADYFYDGKTLPFEAASFDSLFCSQVFEHVFNPEQFLEELARVVKPGGHLLLTVPFIWDEHEKPYDFGRYTSYGLRHLAKSHGFEVIDLQKTAADASLFFQLINVYLYRFTLTRSTYLNIFLTLILIAPLNLLGAIASWLLPSNQDLYLDNVLFARRKVF